MSTGAVKRAVAAPVVTMMPGSSDWTRGASIEDLAWIAEAADRLGYPHTSLAHYLENLRALAEQHPPTGG
jgi:hypothetical protein